MNISKADAIAHLAKWYDANTQVRVTYSTVTGNVGLTGTIKELTSSAIKLAGGGCEMLLYFRMTSEFEYSDDREPPNEVNLNRSNRYPTVIHVKFSNGEHLYIQEFFTDTQPA